MKIALLNKQFADKTDEDARTTAGERFEWLMFKALFVAFIMLIASQAALANLSIRSSVSDNYYIEGEPLCSEAYLFIPCKMELKLINVETCPNLKVLVNGVNTATFNNNRILLELKEGDVVELDGSSVLTLPVVQISAVSENLGSILGKTISVADGITFVARMKIS